MLKLKSKNYSFACKSLLSFLLFTSLLGTQRGVPREDFKDSPMQNSGLPQKSNSLKWISILKDSNLFNNNKDYSVYLSLYGYPLMLKIILMSLIGGKIGESFVLNSLTRSRPFNSNIYSNKQFSNITTTSIPLNSLDNLNEVLSKDKNNPDAAWGRLYPRGVRKQEGVNTIENSFLFNFDNTWKYASSLLFSYLQKRQCSILGRTPKNLTLFGNASKLLSFNNKSSLMEAPNPPISNILLPSKRFENYKKTFNNQYEMIGAGNQNSFNGSIFEKLQLHQQQRLLRRLYKYPIKEFFKSEILSASNSFGESAEDFSPSQSIMQNHKNALTSFNNSYLTLAPLEKTNLTKLTRLSSINWCYKNLLYNRHRTYLTNQWWNGQQGEHNAETTFLSDIDWRYTFVQGPKGNGDINIDFPDSEQFYNPRNRRWFLTSGDWNYWFNIQSELKDIYNHYIYDCFTKAYKYLDQNREIIDFYAELLHQTPLYSPTGLNERELLNLYKRFF